MDMSIRWMFAGVYTLSVFIITPYLPKFIKIASGKWKSSSVSNFVLKAEIIIALFLISFAMAILFKYKRKRKKDVVFLFFLGAIIVLSLIIYRFLPNPYEFTHLPEYAVLSYLLVWALKEGEEKTKKKSSNEGLESNNGEGRKIRIIKNSYLLGGFITAGIGSVDEIYQYFLPRRFFTWYDIILNTMGGILGILIYWGFKEK